MKEYFPYISTSFARELISRTQTLSFSKRGIDKHVYLIDDFAVLSTSQLKIRNMSTRDDNLDLLDELIHVLMGLHNSGVNVIPILGYRVDNTTVNGTGYLVQKRAKGAELYDDAIMKKYYVWSQNRQQSEYLVSEENSADYISYRTDYISTIPQIHYDKFISDILALIDNDIYIDFTRKSNFFYDEMIGFQFIDIDSRTDKLSLTERSFHRKLICAYNGFVPCHFAVSTRILPQLAIDESAITEIGEDVLMRISHNNETYLLNVEQQ